MKIDRYELVKNNIYNVYLSNGEVLTLDENVITDNELLLKKEIDTTLYNKLKSDNDIISLCNMAIKYISIRLRSIKEVRDYLSKKCDNSYYIDMAIDKLIGYKYLDDDIIGSNVIYKGINVGVIKDIERYDKYSLLVILGKKEYLIPYNDNLIDNIDINNKNVYIKDIDGLFDI